ncbi:MULTISPECIES: hypothetical protein [unclassified Leisingera]|uniref:hypothetical protein n=1 Tax=unclassified Leisingera TaxID=2614906 RepID=UPI0010707E2F|nr:MULTISPECIES: hypothetical protein [unclassified Leisingera]QBR36047.1 hypothetical protein ETW23_07735 [Leisingera sp. NJS201]UWQ76810.1 hypothetical protein K3724_10430 [Leisingera sp. M658]
MKKFRHSVSDNAVLRHLERVEGVNISAVRRKIARIADLQADHPFATGVLSGGFSYKIQDGVVTTVLPAPGRRNKSKRKAPKARINGKG